jgi:hypothetical protein
MIQTSYTVTCDQCARHATSGGGRLYAHKMALDDGFQMTGEPEGYLCPICLNDPRWQHRPGRRWTSPEESPIYQRAVSTTS